MASRVVVTLCVISMMYAAIAISAAPIHDAAGNGDLAKVKALLKKDPKLINAPDKDGASPLHHATAGNHKFVVELLLSKNANVNAKKKDGVTPLHIAAAMGRTEIAKLLLAKGAKVDAVDDKDRTPISLAEESGQVEMIELLAAEGMGPAAAIAPGTKIGDVRINPKDGAEMVWVPAGEFLMGSTDADIQAISTYDPRVNPSDAIRLNSGGECPQHKVNLDGYWIYKYEVTVAQYRKFCGATGHTMPDPPRWGWNNDHPMAKMSRADAEEYAAWAGGKLPSEAEWEKAARGTDGRWFPWGNTWDAGKCANIANSRTTKPVTQFPGDVSPYGVIDMAGNVYEWCSDQGIFDYPGSESAASTGAGAVGAGGVCRGGSFVKPPAGVRCAKRRGQDPGSRDEDVGFRCLVPGVVIAPAGSRAGTDDASKENTPLYDGKPGTKIGDVCVNPQDGAEMVWVPAGEFLMGSTDAEIAALLNEHPQYKAEWFDAEKPQRKVHLDGYWIYKYEVTVAQYRKFCEATSMKMSEAPGWGWKDNHPMVNVTWQDAADYAKWAGVSLPTEAQWEKAARGTDGRIYPWGNTWDASKCANNVETNPESTKPVGSYASGASLYGCMDMAGNAWERCADWYDLNYYKNSPMLNPKGPASGSARVQRGGAWLGGVDYDRYRCASRASMDPSDRGHGHIGFRCARTP